MPTLDEITLETEAARHRAAGHDVRPHWCEACREAHLWRDGCGSLGGHHVLAAGTVRHLSDAREQTWPRSEPLPAGGL